MANYFSNRNELENKIHDLIIALDSLRKTEKDARQNYLSELARLIKSRPGLTATQYANILSNDAEERNSIAASIASMGYWAEAYRHPGSLLYVSCNNPSVPALTRKRKAVKRRFVELDEEGNSIGTFEVVQNKTVYGMEED